MTERGKPALQKFIEDFVGGNYVVTVSQVTVTTTPTRIVPNDFERMALTIINTGSVDLRCLPDMSVTNIKGIVLGALGGNLNLVANEDLALTGWDWYAVCASGSTTVELITITRYSAGAA